MKRFALGAALVLAVGLSTPALAALPVGAAAPAFSGQAWEAGKATPFSLTSALRNGPVVFYFFPGANTPGCNVEAQEFARSIDQFKAAGASVIGVTAGNVDELKEFSATHCNGKFPVAAATSQTIKDYDVALALRPGWSNRTSFVIAPDGKIVLAHTDNNPISHVTKTLEKVQAMKAGK